MKQKLKLNTASVTPNLFDKDLPDMKSATYKPACKENPLENLPPESAEIVAV